MKWMDRVERSLGHLAIPNLIRLVAGLNALVFVLYKLNPHVLEWLALDPEAVLRGEVWRVLSYVLIPSFGGPVTDWLFAALYIWFLWWLGDGLEEAMGSFRLNIYFFLGVVATTVAALLTGASFGSTMLNNSLLFAFARFYPDTVIYMMAILPVKMKWLAWFTAFFLTLQFVVVDWGLRFVILMGLANFFAFFGKSIFQASTQRRQVSERRRSFKEAQRPETEALHCCAVCGRTEQVAPELDFRVARDGNEYCTDHLSKTAS